MTEPLLDDLHALLLAAGACQVGAADLTPLPEEVREGLPRGLSLGAVLRPEIIAGLIEGPNEAYLADYERLNVLLTELGQRAAEWLSARGYQASPRATVVGRGPFDAPSLSGPLPHKTVATRAGLGWIGKCALLVTEPFGSAIRLTTVLTDAPLPVGTPVEKSRCGECVSCLEACPARAVSGRSWRVGYERDEFFDAHACRKACREQCEPQGIDETICGRCITVCPWTQAHLRRILTQETL
jgi:epoxyqueuosine reductase QueG